jgi:hypothetical protein
MPEQRLKSNQMMTIGAKELAILVVPKGWIANRSMRIAHVTPMIVARF